MGKTMHFLFFAKFICVYRFRDIHCVILLSKIKIGELIMQIENNVIVGFDKTDKHLFIPKTVVGADYAIADLLNFEPFESITVEEGNTHFYMQDGCLIWRDKKALMIALQGAKIPDDGSVITIAGGAFTNHQQLKEIEIPACVEKINYQAFACTGLEKVTLSDGLKELDAYAFGCN